MTVEGDGVWFGAAVTLSVLEETCLELETSHSGHQLAVFRQIREMLRWFAGKLTFKHYLQFSFFFNIVIILIITAKCC